jgi:alkanesulfonate monooxygenase SsuD/methylene tetrahydromethanopterin reductase-like flavin-dependent oxidoreductase (luciferase family)
MAERVSRVEESIGSIRRLWREESVSQQGQHFSLNEAGLSVKPKQPDGPPVWLAGEVPRAVRRAARFADAWLPLPASTRQETGKLRELYCQERANAGLATPDEVPIIRECYVGSSSKSALADVRGASS